MICELTQPDPVLIKFIDEAEAIIPRGHYVEIVGNKIYIYKDMPNKIGQKYVYMFYVGEITEAPEECLDLLKTILNLG